MALDDGRLFREDVWKRHVTTLARYADEDSDASSLVHFSSARKHPRWSACGLEASVDRQPTTAIALRSLGPNYVCVSGKQLYKDSHIYSRCQKKVQYAMITVRTLSIPA